MATKDSETVHGQQHMKICYTVLVFNLENKSEQPLKETLTMNE